MSDTSVPPKTKILAIDDDQFIRKMFHALLEKAGFQVISANNGTEGVDKALEIDPDIILLDIMMPELDGFQALEILRKKPQTQSIPIIIVTARADSDTLLKAIKLGANDFIAKPFTRNMILQKIRFALKEPEKEKNENKKLQHQNKPTFIDTNAFNKIKLNFITSFDRIYMEMIRLISQQKRPELKRKVSEVEKGCSTYEIPQPLSKLNEFHNQIQSGEWKSAAKTLEKVYAIFKTLQEELQKELNKPTQA